ncbi:MAG TPA: hypothetical protein VGD98_03425 [Ktedonobacteraceae bacterium]
MNPYTSYTILHALHEERLAQAERYSAADQASHQVVRSLARLLGHTLIVIGNQLVHAGQ